MSKQPYFSIIGEDVKVDIHIPIKPIETMIKSKRYLAVLDNSGSNDSDQWIVAFWHPIGEFWTSDAAVVAQLLMDTPRADQVGIPIKGWALELPPL